MWFDIIKNWAYGADNIDEYLESVRRQIDSVLDMTNPYKKGSTSFNQKVKEIKEEIANLDKERFDRWQDSMKTNVAYSLAPNYFEEGNSMYERLVDRFGHYASRRAAIPHELIKGMARHEHQMELLSLFGLEEAKKYTVDLMKDWTTTGYFEDLE